MSSRVKLNELGDHQRLVSLWAELWQELNHVKGESRSIAIELNEDRTLIVRIQWFVDGMDVKGQTYHFSVDDCMRNPQFTIKSILRTAIASIPEEHRSSP